MPRPESRSWSRHKLPHIVLVNLDPPTPGRPTSSPDHGRYSVLIAFTGVCVAKVRILDAAGILFYLTLSLFSALHDRERTIGYTMTKEAQE